MKQSKIGRGPHFDFSCLGNIYLNHNNSQAELRPLIFSSAGPPRKAEFRLGDILEIFEYIYILYILYIGRYEYVRYGCFQSPGATHKSPKSWMTINSNGNNHDDDWGYPI